MLRRHLCSQRASLRPWLTAVTSTETIVAGIHSSSKAFVRSEGQPGGHPSGQSSGKGKQGRVGFFDDGGGEGELSKKQHRTQYNVDPFSLKPSEEHYEHALVSSEWLARQTQRPRKVRMLARDFIHDSLYNPHYGYFSRHAVLLPDRKATSAADVAAAAGGQTAFDFSSFADDRAFAVAVEERYREFENEMQAEDVAEAQRSIKETDEQIRSVLRPLRKREEETSSTPHPSPSSASQGKKAARIISAPPRRESRMEAALRKGRMDMARQLMNKKEAGEHDRDVKAMVARQVWHTPTELFKPWYAFAVARYMVEHRQQGQPLRVYEVGAGSGALASDILDYVQDKHPELYKDMQYNIVEISSRLANQQRSTLKKHTNKVNVINKSILEWEQEETEPCFFLAMEVLDNLTHDVVRYATDTLYPYQAIVSIDASGDMHELWEPVQDETIRRCLALTTQEGGKQSTSIPVWLALLPGALRRAFTQTLPFYPNLTSPQYVPTGSLQLLDVLAKRFPQHRLVISDFDKLPDSLEGVNAPVVQTRLNGTMIAVTKYTVHQGFFDIFFPTNFSNLKRMHAAVLGDRKGAAESARIESHSAFLSNFADVDKTTCRDGSNPMLAWYANASWFLS